MGALMVGRTEGTEPRGNDRFAFGPVAAGEEGADTGAERGVVLRRRRERSAWTELGAPAIAITNATTTTGRRPTGRRAYSADGATDSSTGRVTDGVSDRVRRKLRPSRRQRRPPSLVGNARLRNNVARSYSRSHQRHRMAACKRPGSGRPFAPRAWPWRRARPHTPYRPRWCSWHGCARGGPDKSARRLRHRKRRR